MLFTKMFASFAPRADIELALAAVLEATREVPLPWLEKAVASFNDDADRQWPPSVSEIRTRTARLASMLWLRDKGRPSREGIHSSTEIDVGHWLGKIHSMPLEQLTGGEGT